ncbi:hypothetical protein FRC04_008924 [Tulasnella sp. 424]|nr:hypothetical protein FRC04_008924 [Tulasnella sp. 424]KAG8973823.1 hypothetical protein FRC05_008242 [Tulasnella sp. 425]
MAQSDTDTDLKSLLQKLESKSGLGLSSSSINSQISPVLAALLTLRQTINPFSRIPCNLKAQKATQNLIRPFSLIIESRLATTSLEEVIPALGLFTALSQIDSATGSGIFLQDGVAGAVLDVPDLFEGKNGITASGRRSTAISSQRFQALSASGPGARHLMAPGSSSKGHVDAGLSRGTAEDVSSDTLSSLDGPATDGAVEEARRKDDDESLAKLMKNLIVGSKETVGPGQPLTGSSQSILDAVEGLAYSSMDSSVKESLSADTAFLTRLFSLVPPPKRHQTGAKPTVNVTSEILLPEEKASVALLYGISVIVLNLVALRPKLSEEEKQVDRLKRMTKEGARTGGKLADQDGKEAEDQLATDDAVVKKKCKRVLKAGVVSALVSMSHRKESEGIRRALGRIFLSLVEDKENRASFTSLKDAPVAPPPKKPPSKFDSTVAGSSSPPAKSLDPLDLPAIQALAKLPITASPILLFGPDASSSLDGVHPLSHLLLNPSSTLLQKLESLMALTNLASLGPLIASRVATHKEPGLGTVLNKTETPLLDDNSMVRRAATELLCDLVASDTVWERYTGEKPDGTRSKPSEEGDKALVTSGALAMLANAPDVPRSLLDKMKSGAEVFRVLIDLIASAEEGRRGDEEDGGDDDDETNLPPPTTPEIQSQLAYRGVVCTRTLLTNLPTDAETVKSVVKAAKVLTWEELWSKL